jgi:hypothetical protein
MSYRKAQRRNNIHMGSAEQKAALAKFQQDLGRALPYMTEMGRAAQALHQAMVNAPIWRVAETPRPDGAPDESMFSVGHAQVNYVDHIEHEGAEEK